MKVAGANTTTIKYTYNAFGARVAKSTKINTSLATMEYTMRDINGLSFSVVARSQIGNNFTITTTEQSLYGSGRIGTLLNPSTQFTITAANLPTFTYPLMTSAANVRFKSIRTIGQKRYEFCDHLQNVRNVISDVRLSNRVGTANPSFVFHRFATEDLELFNTYAFGMPKTETNDYVIASSFKYRYGFNGQEKCDEIAGVGNHNTALFWEYDTRLGRRWNLDPVVKSNESGYATFGNSPISYSDLLGDLAVFSSDSKDQQAIHNKYYNFYEQENGKDKLDADGNKIKSSTYSKEYAKAFDKINDDDSKVFVIGQSHSELSLMGGESGVCIRGTINGKPTFEKYGILFDVYSVESQKPSSSFGGSLEHVYMEEIKHAVQVIDKGDCASIENEVEAKRFAVTIAGPPKSTYNSIGNNKVKLPTQLRMVMASDIDIKDYDYSPQGYLKRGIKIVENGIQHDIGGDYNIYPFECAPPSTKK